WFCVHMGRQALMQRGKVVHISLEMDEEYVLARYMQSLFAVARYNREYTVSSFELDEVRRVIGWSEERRRPDMSFSNPKIRSYLRENIKKWGLRLGNVIIKRFPTGGLTIRALEAYLDYLEQEGFIPTMLLVDYPDLMALGDPRFMRVEL